MVKAKTDFIKILEEIHKTSDFSYGRILICAWEIGHKGKHDDLPRLLFEVDDKKLTEMLKKLQKHWKPLSDW